MNGIGKPIRLTVELNGGQATNNFDRIVKALGTSFDRVGDRVNVFGKTVTDTFESGRRAVRQFADDVDRLNTRLGLTESRLASIGRSLTSLRMPSSGASNATAAYQ